MGKLSTTNPPRPSQRPFPVVMLLALLLAIWSTTAPSQTSVSAVAVPLLRPAAVAFDAQGNLYLADTSNHIIRKVDTSGHITTFAGTGIQGYSGDSGLATAAQLDSPQGLALDTSGNLYLADTHNHRIRKVVLSTGIITTIAGTGAPAFSGDSSLAPTANLNLPTALALDTSNNLYLADTANHRIRKIAAATGIITTIAGTGTQGFSGDGAQATLATIDSPSGLATDPLGNLYLADTHNHRLRKIIASTGIITSIAGSGAPGFSGDGSSATAATVALPTGLAIDSAANLYFADTENHRIRRIDSTTGTITTAAGNGTQAFAGDTLSAITSSLDSPRATVISPTGILTLADTGNQRVRQRAADATINTIAGLGVTTPGVLTLAAPSVITYGTGTLTANLTSTTTATGLVTFLDSSSGATTTLGTAALSANTASISTAALPAGTHSITATFAGDLSHTAAQSPATTLTITPQQLTASVLPVSILYGQPIPTLSGTATGILPQDAATTSVSFATTAATQSPAGIYLITATITGPAAGNYSLPKTPAFLTITQASATITLTTPTANPSVGSPITLSVQVATTTSGSPSGTIAFLDGTTSLAATPLTATGSASLTTSTLSSGPHTLSTHYSGDTNFLAATSIPTLLTVGTGTPTSPDFTLSATGATSQAVLSGLAVSFNFTAQMQSGTLSSPITLAASGLPLGATASFNPAYLPPGNTTVPFTLTIRTSSTTAANQSTPSRILPITSAIALLFLPFLSLTRRTASLLTIPFAIFVSIFCLGCGDRINAALKSTTSTHSYTIAVTGTATSPTGATLQHTTNATLQIQ